MRPEPVDPRSLDAELRAYVGRLDEIRSFGTVEEQKTFLRGFIDRIEVKPREGEALVFWKKLPAPPATGSNGARMSFTVVAGARSDRVQRNLIVVVLGLDDHRLNVTHAA